MGRKRQGERLFQVEIWEQGGDRKVYARVREHRVARFLCRELCQKGQRAIVRVDTSSPRAKPPGGSYTVWLLDLDDGEWMPLYSAKTAREAFYWFRHWEEDPCNAVAVIWPDWSPPPTERLRALGAQEPAQ